MFSTGSVPEKLCKQTIVFVRVLRTICQVQYLYQGSSEVTLSDEIAGRSMKSLEVLFSQPPHVQRRAFHISSGGSRRARLSATLLGRSLQVLGFHCSSNLTLSFSCSDCSDRVLQRIS